MAKFDPKTTLRALWSKKEKDIVYYFPCSPDGHMLNGYFVYAKDSFQEHGLLKELEKRGYDLTTLKFSIRKKEK